MPGIVKKLAIIAAVEGLILQPAGQRNQRSIQINYSTHEISSLASSTSSSSISGHDFHGIVGLLTIAPVSYLIAILRREQVAQVRGVPVFVITDVALIPLSSQSEAKRAIEQAKRGGKVGHEGHASSGADSDTSEDEEVHAEDEKPEDDGQTSLESLRATPNEDLSGDRPGGPERSTSNVVEDVISRKGQYGRFAERWFSRKGWSTDKRRAQGMSTADEDKPPPVGAAEDALPKDSGEVAVDTNPADMEIPSQTSDLRPRQNSQSGGRKADTANALVPKLLRTTRMLLSSRSFFFSYDFDVTRRLGGEIVKNPDIPLSKSVDPLFFWNHYLALPFTESGYHSFILPIMQGFVGQRAFSINRKAEDPAEAISNAEQDASSVIQAQKEAKKCDDDSEFLLTLISRRSIKRPGLRYLRRGVDEDGNAANSVETEQILSRASWSPAHKVYSFTQIRGSIPLFFSQSPYSFKPIPVFQHSPETNHKAFRRHFMTLENRYGDVQIALLVDKKGGEAEIGRKYEEHTKQVNADDGIAGRELGFEWFDFHAACRGMKFENVSILMNTLGAKLDEFGETTELNSSIEKTQSGILRTNCMDCLDRTNVVQSATGQRALEKQLKAESIEVDLLTDTSTQWFNTLWADNGDAISRQYSSTAALKGDFTRTRRRNYRGAINDLGLTLSRYYNNIVNDYFSQAAIDYLLGNVTSQVFEEFEATLENRDPAMSMSKVRANAVETSSKIVIADQSEDLVGGWTLLSPREQNTVRTYPFEEICLLITDAALYRVNFDWNVEKVSSFERVDLRSITGIMKGTYITSTLTASQTDPEKNFGFVIKYKPGKEDIARVNTRSLSSAVGVDGNEASALDETAGKGTTREDASTLKILAFKALPARDSFASMEGHEAHAMSEKELVSNVCDEIQRAALGDHNGATGFIEEKDIISLQEARKSTGLLEQWGHSIKKLVWA